MLSTKLQTNIDKFKQAFGQTSDLVSKDFKIGKLDCAILFLKGLCDTIEISASVLAPAMRIKSVPKTKVLEFIQTKVLTVAEIKAEKEEDKIINALVNGNAVIFVSGQKQALVLGIDKYKERGITEPPTSAVLKGPREGFIENLKTNVSLLRRIISSPNLRNEYIDVGRYSATKVCVMYINGIADKKIVNTVIQRIKKIDIDGIIDSFYIASFLEERPNSMFKQIGVSEKPDIVAAKMLEGRIAVIVDGSPIVLTLPFILLEDIQTSDDYYNQSARGTFLRLIRIVGLVVTLLLPGLYISIQLYHYKAIPLKFLITIINATQGLPLNPFAEILFVVVLFEILYEASIRMPKYLGLALSVVGALILGDTAVQAGIISPPTVLMVAISGITLYTVPDQATQLIIMRFMFTLAGGIFGFYGVILSILFFIIYFNDFDIYGTAYLSPFVNSFYDDYKDAIFKTDIVHMTKRPKSIKNVNQKRLKK